MADKSTVKITFLGDASALARASKQAQDSVGAVGRAGGAAGRGLTSLGGIAKTAIAGVMVGGLAAGAKSVFDMAAQMQLMDNKAKTVFGSQIGVVQKWAKANANAMGLTSKQAVGLSANFADLLIPMGFTREKAAQMSTSVVGLSGALAQWSGGTKTAAEVSDILAKAMLGERDGLKALGISISDADVKGRLLKLGKDKLTGAALEQAKAEATQALIMEKSTDAQAAYANGADTLAGKKAVLTAKFAEFRDKAIATLIPLILKFGEFMGQFLAPVLEFVTDKAGTLRTGFDRLATYVTGTLVPAAMLAWTFFKANLLPVLVAMGEFIMTKVVPPVIALAGVIVGAWMGAVRSISGAIESHREELSKLFTAVGTVIAVVVKLAGPILGVMFKAAFALVGTIIGTAIGVIAGLVRAVTGISNAAVATKDAVVGAFNTVVGFITGLPGRISAVASGMFDGIKNAFRAAINFIIDGWNGLDFKIPGFDPPGPGPKFGGFTLGVPNIPRLAKGGIVSSPTVAMIGEAGPEAVVPLGRGMGGGTTVNVYVAGSVVAERDLADSVQKVLIDYQRRNPSLGFA